MYGWRGRIGLLVPSINTTMETEFWRIAPEGVSVHTARIAGGRHGTPEELRGMENASKQAAADVAMVEPDVVVYGCTSGSFFEGPEWNRKICEQLTAIAKAPTVTTAGAMAECFLAGRFQESGYRNALRGGHQRAPQAVPQDLRHRRRDARHLRHARHVRSREDRARRDLSKGKGDHHAQSGSGVRSVHATPRDGSARQASSAISASRCIRRFRLRRGRHTRRWASIRASPTAAACSAAFRRLALRRPG